MNNKAKIIFAIIFIHLIIINASSSQEYKFEDALIKATCALNEDIDNILCETDLTKIKETDEDANADAVLVCQDVDFIVLAHNPGTFIIEHRSHKNGNWSDAVVSDNITITIHHLEPKRRYQFRLHRVFQGGFSGPEVTGWFETMSDLHEPLDVTNISKPIFELEADNPRLLRLLMDFTPAEDRACYYEVVCWATDNGNKHLDYKKPRDFNITFINLRFASEYRIMITAKTKRGITSHMAVRTITTPPCLDYHKNLKTCAPAEVSGLNATAIHKVGNIFDLNITWDEPEFIPDFYNVELYPITADDEEPSVQRVSGNATGTIFPKVRIVEQFDVHINAVSQGGRGQKVWDRFTVNIPSVISDLTVTTNLVIIVMASLASFVLVIGTGLFALHRHREKRRRIIQSSEYSKNIKKVENPSHLEAVKGIENAEMITAEKSLLIPLDEWEISQDRLEIKKVLGRGAFGVVKLGSLRDTRGNVTDVAVKMLRDDPNEEELRGFKLEIKIMKSAGQHPNIVSLLGCCTILPRPLLIVEYCSKGDLQSFLRAIMEKATLSVMEINKRFESNQKFLGSNKIIEDLNSEDRFSTYLNGKDEMKLSNFVANRTYDIDQEALRDTDMVTVTDLLNFARQIATGMEFLSSNRIVHRDLAARNVLVCDDRTVKISDFGLSRDIYAENVYKKQGNGRVPVKWMAIEALTHQVYSTHSDVWSFGILLWEIVTLGSSPYPDILSHEVLNQLRLGYRMERPPNCSMPLYKVMMACWQTKPKDRPSFTMLRLELDRLIDTTTKNEYLDFRDVSKGTLSDEEDSRITNSRYTYFPVQLRYVNDNELQEIAMKLEQD